MTTTISVRVEFGGGLELLFSNQKSHTVNVPTITANGKPPDVNYLIHWLRENLLKEREELFLENDTVWVPVLFTRRFPPFQCILDVYSRRPGILVLINDTDWELEGEGDYLLKESDEVVFISTLHGG